MGTTSKQPSEPELPPRVPGERRQFSEDFRRQAVAYYDSLPDDGSKGSYLRRTGIYSSQITKWRSGTGNQQKQRGRRPMDSRSIENAELREEVARLQDELTRSNAVIEIQKKKLLRS